MKSKKLRQILAIATITTMTSTIAPLTAFATWSKDSDNNWSFVEDGNKARGWKKVGESWYNFDTNGKMQTGWVRTSNSKWYYMNPDGAMKTGWLKDVDGKWYYLASDGEMKTGWLKDIDGKWYYLASNGAMKTGWLKDTDGKWYFTDISGAMQTGVVEVQGKVYVLEASGAMATGSTVIYGQTYTIDESGAVVGDKLPTTNKTFTNQGTVITPSATTPTNTTTTTSSTSSSSSSGSHNHSSSSNSTTTVGSLADLSDGSSHTGSYNISAPGTYGASSSLNVPTITGNVSIADAVASSGETIKLKNLKITGTLTIDFGEGTVILDNVTVNGVNVSNVGQHSLDVIDSFITNLEVNDKNNDAHIVVKGSASITNTTVHSGAQLDVASDATNANPFANIAIAPTNATTTPSVGLSGQFNNVVVEGNSNVTVAGIIGTILVNQEATGTQISIAPTATVATLNVNAPTTVTGAANIRTANLGAQTEMDQRPARILALAGATVTVGGVSTDVDGTISSIPTEIKPALDTTAIKTAIMAANAAKANVQISADGSDVSMDSNWVTLLDNNNLDTAIVSARTAEILSTTTQQVIDAVTALNSAVSTYNAAKAHGTQSLDTTAITTAIIAANAANANVQISADGSDVSMDSKWVTQSVSNALDAAIATATTAKTTVTTTKQATDAAAALNSAVSTYNAAKTNGLVDKYGLKDDISHAYAEYTSAVEGTSVGQYAVGLKAALLTAIDAAKAVMDKVNATQTEVNNEVNALDAAIDTFEKGKVADSTTQPAVTITDVTISTNSNTDTVNIGDKLTLTVNMSDGQPAGDRVEYFAVVQDSQESTDGTEILQSNTNTMIIPSTYIDDEGNTQSINGKYIDFGARIKSDLDNGKAAERLGPVGGESTTTPSAVTTIQTVYGNTNVTSISGSNINVVNGATADEVAGELQSTDGSSQSYAFYTAYTDETNNTPYVSGSRSLNDVILVVKAEDGTIAQYKIIEASAPASAGIDFMTNYMDRFIVNTNELRFVVKGKLTGYIDTSKLKYIISGSSEETVNLSDGYSKVNSIMNIAAGQYNYSSDDNGNTMVFIKLTDNDAAAIKSLIGYGNDSTSTAVNRLVAENNWYPGASAGIKQIPIINNINRKNESGHRIVSNHYFNKNGAEIATDGYGLNDNESDSIPVYSEAKYIVFAADTLGYTPNIDPTSGYMKIVEVNQDIINNGITLDNSGWIEINGSNFGPTVVDKSPVVDSNILTQHDDTTTPGAVTLTWNKATDDTTPQNELKYYLYMMENKYYDTIDEWETNAKLLNENNLVDINSFRVTNLNDTSNYYFKLIVEDANGNKTAYTTEHRLPIEADKTALISEIKEAKQFANNAVVGTKAGNFAQVDLDAFKAAIASAEAVVNSTSATQDDLNNAYNALQQAKQSFYWSVITGLISYTSSVSENDNFDQTIQVKIEGTGDFVKGLSAGNIKLGGDFTGLTIKSVTVDINDDYKANVELTGDLKKSTGIGTITVNTAGWYSPTAGHDITCNVGVTTSAAVEVDKTALIDAITAATTNSTSAEVSVDGSEVLTTDKWVLQADLTTYTNAIASAQAVVNNPDTTQNKVQDAVGVLGAATDAFNSAKKSGTKVVTGVDEEFSYDPKLDSTHKIITFTFNKNIINNTADLTELKNSITISTGASEENYNALGENDTVEISGNVLKITFDQALPVGDNWIFVDVKKNALRDEAGNVWGTNDIYNKYDERTTNLNPNSNVYHNLLITVNGTEASYDYNSGAYNVEFTYGTDLTKLAASDITVKPGYTDIPAKIGTPVTSDGGKTWTVDVTAEGGPTVTYTINATVAETDTTSGSESGTINTGTDATSGTESGTTNTETNATSGSKSGTISTETNATSGSESGATNTGTDATSGSESGATNTGTDATSGSESGTTSTGTDATSDTSNAGAIA